jgi:hypothetical protein
MVGTMTDKTEPHATLKLGLVTAGCLLLIQVVTTQVLHVRADAALFGPLLLFLIYFVSDSWTPVPEFAPSVFWSAAIVFTALIEIAFAYFFALR